MIPSDEPTITFHGDPEHAGIRLAVLPMLVVGYVVGFTLVRLLASRLMPGNASLNLIACLAGFPMGLAVAAGGETLLKRIWRSGKRLIVGPRSLRLEARRGETARVPRDADLALHFWHFPLAGYPRGGRERRAQQGWLCLACQARRDAGRISFFTFMPPAEAAPLIEAVDSHALDPTAVYDTSLSGRFTQPTVRPRLPAEVIAGPDGPFWLAERHRWEAGLELSKTDYAAALRLLTARAGDA